MVDSLCAAESGAHVIGTDIRRALFRTWTAALLACLPILVLLLVPSLMRSRAGSEGAARDRVDLLS